MKVCLQREDERGWEKEIVPAVCSICLTSDQMMTELWHSQSQLNEHYHYLEAFAKLLCIKYLFCISKQQPEKSYGAILYLILLLTNSVCFTGKLYMEFSRNTPIYESDTCTYCICWHVFSNDSGMPLWIGLFFGWLFHHFGPVWNISIAYNGLQWNIVLTLTRLPDFSYSATMRLTIVVQSKRTSITIW